MYMHVPSTSLQAFDKSASQRIVFQHKCQIAKPSLYSMNGLTLLNLFKPIHSHLFYSPSQRMEAPF